MNNLIENIVSYIDYLNKDCELIVSVHFSSDVFNHIHDSLASMILPYNCHTNAYCVMAKNANHNKCLLNQKKILAKCQLCGKLRQVSLFKDELQKRRDMA